MVAETTKKQYAFYIDQIKGIAKTADITNTKAMMGAIEGLRKSDGSELGSTTKRNYYIALAFFTKRLPLIHEVYKKAYENINKELKKTSKPPPPPAIPYADLQTLGLMIMGEESEPLDNRILIGLVTQLPPVRLDYAHLHVFSSPKAIPPHYEGNYIVLGRNAAASKFVAQKHKTAKHYGALERTLTDDLFSLVKEWKGKNPDAVLLDISENALGRRISSLFRKYVGEDITMNDVRHSYVTAMRKGDRSKAEVESIAHLLGHSLAMNYDYRRD